MTASQRTANPNGCAEPTKKEDDGIDTNIEALEEYICDNICRYREEDLNQEELDYFCHYCELQKHTDGIKAEYDKINHFDHSQAMKLMDRYKHMHNLAYDVKILKIEPVDDTNSAIYLDTEPFNTTLTTCISAMPWRTGSTDSVLGSDGSPFSNTDNKNPFKIQGIETGYGAYEVLSNVFMDIVTDEDGTPKRDVYICMDASLLTTDMNVAKTRYKKVAAQVTYTAASWKYISKCFVDPALGIMVPTETKAGSTTGFCNGLYTDSGTSGQREWLSLGYLSLGTVYGLWLLGANGGVGSASWIIVSGVSPNGTRGEWQAAA